MNGRSQGSSATLLDSVELEDIETSGTLTAAGCWLIDWLVANVGTDAKCLAEIGWIAPATCSSLGIIENWSYQFLTAGHPRFNGVRKKQQGIMARKQLIESKQRVELTSLNRRRCSPLQTGSRLSARSLCGSQYRLSDDFFFWITWPYLLNKLWNRKHRRFSPHLFFMRPSCRSQNCWRNCWTRCWSVVMSSRELVCVGVWHGNLWLIEWSVIGTVNDRTSDWLIGRWIDCLIVCSLAL